MRGQTWRLLLQYLKSLLRFFGRSILHPSLYPQIVMDFFFFCSILFHLSRPTTYQKESRNSFANPISILIKVRHKFKKPYSKNSDYREFSKRRIYQWEEPPLRPVSPRFCRWAPRLGRWCPQWGAGGSPAPPLRPFAAQTNFRFSSRVPPPFHLAE